MIEWAFNTNHLLVKVTRRVHSCGAWIILQTCLYDFPFPLVLIQILVWFLCSFTHLQNYKTPQHKLEMIKRVVHLLLESSHMCLIINKRTKTRDQRRSKAFHVISARSSAESWLPKEMPTTSTSTYNRALNVIEKF